MKISKSKIKNQNYGIFIFLLTAYCLLLTASDAHAMHISEGILPFNWRRMVYSCNPFVWYGMKLES
jgi:hypothetical protein